ncbi:transposase [Erysipelothrix sp. HDW6A]|nr:transposase [Erysipelothrix sp. HDW6A]QIK57602.1 transposase [Erysipelothrix sp. HDW6A]
MKRYTNELKNEIIQLHLKEGRTIKSLSKEYYFGSGTLQY